MRGFRKFCGWVVFVGLLAACSGNTASGERSASCEGDPPADRCNTCSCVNGSWTCTARACADECPEPLLPPPNVRCEIERVFARDPGSGRCCEYDSSCFAPRSWATFASAAACENPDACTPGETRNDGCNTCSCTRDGQWACTQRACGTACGARAGNTCGTPEYCAYEEGQLCGAADAESVCLPRPGGCDAVYEPVCGCDGQSYGNSCEAAMAGTGVMSAGTCPGR
jgi:hypothetical protein